MLFHNQFFHNLFEKNAFSLNILNLINTVQKKGNKKKVVGHEVLRNKDYMFIGEMFGNFK